MPITYAFDPRHPILRTVWKGEIRAADLRAFWTEMLEDARALSLQRSLADLRHAELALTGEELDAAIRDIALPRLEGRRWRTAILVGHPAQFGTARQFSVFADSFSEDAIFHDEAEALAWLLEPFQRPDPPRDPRA